MGRCVPSLGEYPNADVCPTLAPDKLPSSRNGPRISCPFLGSADLSAHALDKARAFVQGRHQAAQPRRAGVLGANQSTTCKWEEPRYESTTMPCAHGSGGGHAGSQRTV